METNFSEDSSEPVTMAPEKITEEWKNTMGTINSLLC